MSYFRDLSHCTYFSDAPESLRSIGWLEPDREYSQGQVPDGFIERMRVLVANPWAPQIFFGGQPCGFCGEGYSVRNVFVPGRNVVYVSPEGIIHYVERHQYKPPDEYVEAVVESPEPTSVDYYIALRKGGLEINDPRACAEDCAMEFEYLQHMEESLQGIDAASMSKLEWIDFEEKVRATFRRRKRATLVSRVLRSIITRKQD